MNKLRRIYFDDLYKKKAGNTLTLPFNTNQINLHRGPHSSQYKNQ